MELKDVILSTIAEIGEEVQRSIENESSVKKGSEDEKEESGSPIDEPRYMDAKEDPISSTSDLDAGEMEFLQNLRERLLVLFEGFQSPNNKRVEAKIELTLNFLEYLLATVDERIDQLKKS